MSSSFFELCLCYVLDTYGPDIKHANIMKKQNRNELKYLGNEESDVS